MKKPWPHLVAMETSASPSGYNCVTVCGVKIEKAEVLMYWDEQGMIQKVSVPVGICNDCRDAIYTALPRSLCYIYAVREKAGEPEGKENL